MKPWERLGLPEPKSEASRGELSLIDYEVYSGLETKPPYWIRLDGWRFHRVCQGFKKPFDLRLARTLVRIARELLKLFNGQLAYLFSDEINLLFLKPSGFKRIEKLDSILAGIASAIFSLKFGKPAAFDCRVIPMPKRTVLRYLRWRQAECFRNHNNAWAYWLLRKQGLSARQATRKLTGLKTPQLFDLCRSLGKPLDRTPGWQRKGILLYWKIVKKKGWDPIKRKHVWAERRRIVEKWDPPWFHEKEGKELIGALLNV
ncbi:MAG: tRNA 5'-guanylyltransferase [Candidatus Aenigmatarchaeota archaeon]|nr:MAG: tRNA 5'-guanylyltransferase [Candidatus Aenigmarchaeota archaeon]